MWHNNLVSAVTTLSKKYNDTSPTRFVPREVVNPEHVKRLKIDKDWYVAEVLEKSAAITDGSVMAELLNKLDRAEIVNCMADAHFNKLFLKDCLCVGVNSMETEPPIVSAGIECVLKSIADVSKRIPEPHQVYHPVQRPATLSELKYSDDLKQLFTNEEFVDLLSCSASNISSYVNSLSHRPSVTLPDATFEDTTKLAVICLEFLNYLTENDTSRFHINLMELMVNAAEEIFKHERVYDFLAADANISWFCSAANSIFQCVVFLLKNDDSLPVIPKYVLKDTVEGLETKSAGQASRQLYILVAWLFEVRNTKVDIPNFLYGLLKSMIIRLSRFPLVNSFILIPSRTWKTGWLPQTTGTFNTQISSFPIEFLQEVDILEEYVFRVTLLGWISKKQFEETWMCLLSVLCSPLDNLDSSKPEHEVVRTTSLAIKAITELLLQTLRHPIAGYPDVSKFIHVPRNVESCSVKNLHRIEKCAQCEYNKCTFISRNCKFRGDYKEMNLEKLTSNYSYGQMSVKSFTSVLSTYPKSEGVEVSSEECQRRTKSLETTGLDIKSCLQFLLDYYSQLVKSQSLTNTRILYEVIRSITEISDLFTEKSQFVWMMDTFFDLSNLQIDEDELIQQYIIIGICKAAGILTPDLETFEFIRKLLNQYLKSPYLSSRIACLEGLLYLLEGCHLSNITISGPSEEMQLILPCVVEYVQMNINTNTRAFNSSQKHSLLVWSLAFFLLENLTEVYAEQTGLTNVLLTAFDVLRVKSSNPVHFVIMKGLERLLTVKNSIIIKKHTQKIVHIALDKIKQENPAMALLGTKLLMRYMYKAVDQLQNVDTPTKSSRSPEDLFLTMENISAIFECIKKGHSSEVEILCFMLSNILVDIFSPADIFTKVIGEFLSAQQPHTKLFSRVVFQVFDSAIRQDQLCLLQDWIVFNISNFTSSFSIGMATWCLTCFFVSASTNEWLRCYFPYIQARMGRYEYEDKEMFCIAGADFYGRLSSSNQRKTFIANINKSKDQPDSPFNDLLLSL